jgi:predicted permease
MNIFANISPIFAVVILGYFTRRSGYISKELLGSANRLVFYLAIPALIFRAVSKASFTTDLNTTVLVITILSTTSIYVISWLFAKCTSWNLARRGSFVQCAGHGNHGFVGLPVALYCIGDSGLVKAAILAGFLFMLQNILSVLALEANGADEATIGDKIRKIGRSTLRNPIIISAFAGMVVSWFEIEVPGPAIRFLDIMSGMAAPLSLLLIGASLSFDMMRKNFFSVVGVVIIKLVCLPLLGIILFLTMSLNPDDYLPALILLATPTATVAYVMAGEMGGDSEFAAAAISTSTLASAVTYLLWLTIASYL